MYDTHCVVTLLSLDAACPPQPLAISATSAALQLARAPLKAPLAAVHIAWDEQDGPVVAPAAPNEQPKLSLLYAGTQAHALMMEVQATQLPEAELTAAFRAAHAAIQSSIQAQQDLLAQAGISPKHWRLLQPTPEQAELAHRVGYAAARDALRASSHVKQDRSMALAAVKSSVREALQQGWPDISAALVDIASDTVICNATRHAILEAAVPAAPLVGAQQTNAQPLRVPAPGGASTWELSDVAAGARADGRSSREVRPLHAAIDVLPRVHGSAEFARGGTATLATVTLGPPGSAQRLNTAQSMSEMDVHDPAGQDKRFMLHYDFPPYCVGESGKVWGLNRRSIGHGALAEKAIAPCMPSREEFPYVVRATSEVMGSDGSSSMASVCGASLALMDAGVPLPQHVAGISVGLVTPDASSQPRLDEDATPAVLLTDILGFEDHCGDMDYKVAGTAAGVTAVQLDLKLPGVPLPVLEQGLWQAREAREQLLGVLADTLPQSRTELKPAAPRMAVLSVPLDLRPRIIGPGGVVLKGIQEETRASIVLSEEGQVQVFAPTEQGVRAAVSMIQAILDVAMGTGPVAGSVGTLAPGVEPAPGDQGDEHAGSSGGSGAGSGPMPSNVAAIMGLGMRVGQQQTITVEKVLQFGVVATVLGVQGAGVLHAAHMPRGPRGKLPRVESHLGEGDVVQCTVIDVDALGRAKFSLDDWARVQKCEASEPEAATQPTSAAESSAPAPVSEPSAVRDANAAAAPTASAAPAPESGSLQSSAAARLSSLRAPKLAPGLASAIAAQDPADASGLHRWPKSCFAYLGAELEATAPHLHARE